MVTAETMLAQRTVQSVGHQAKHFSPLEQFALLRAITLTPDMFPKALVRVENDEEQLIPVISCPYCRVDLDEGEITAVDTAERWTYSGAVEMNDDSGATGVVSFNFDDSGEFDSTLFYMHDPCMLPFDLPDGYTEDA